MVQPILECTLKIVGRSIYVAISRFVSKYHLGTGIGRK